MQILGPDGGDETSVRVLNRIMIWQKGQGEDMITYEPDPRHAEIIMKEMGVESSKPLTSPAVRSEVEDDEGEDQLAEEQSTAIRSIVARAGHLTLDGPDIQYVCKEVSSAMASPCERNLDMLRRFAKYLRGRARLVHRCWRPNKPDTMKVHTDANWAGDKRSRKSASGGVIFFG